MNCEHSVISKQTNQCTDCGKYLGHFVQHGVDMNYKTGKVLEPSTIPAAEPLASMLPDTSSPHTELYHNVKVGKEPALRAPKVPTGTTIEASVDPLDVAVGKALTQADYSTLEYRIAAACDMSLSSLTGRELAQSPMLQAPDRVSAYLRANPEVTVALMSGIVRPAMLRELSRAARGVIPVPTPKIKNSDACRLCGQIRSRHITLRSCGSFVEADGYSHGKKVL